MPRNYTKVMKLLFFIMRVLRIYIHIDQHSIIYIYKYFPPLHHAVLLNFTYIPLHQK